MESMTYTREPFYFPGIMQSIRDNEFRNTPSNADLGSFIKQEAQQYGDVMPSVKFECKRESVDNYFPYSEASYLYPNHNYGSDPHAKGMEELRLAVSQKSSNLKEEKEGGLPGVQKRKKSTRFGKKRVNIELINNKGARRSCLNKRMRGLIKKASELEKLCGMEVYCSFRDRTDGNIFRYVNVVDRDEFMRDLDVQEFAQASHVRVFRPGDDTNQISNLHKIPIEGIMPKKKSGRKKKMSEEEQERHFNENLALLDEASAAIERLMVGYKKKLYTLVDRGENSNNYSETNSTMSYRTEGSGAHTFTGAENTYIQPNEGNNFRGSKLETVNQIKIQDNVASHVTVQRSISENGGSITSSTTVTETFSKLGQFGRTLKEKYAEPAAQQPLNLDYLPNFSDYPELSFSTADIQSHNGYYDSSLHERGLVFGNYGTIVGEDLL